MGKYFLLQLKRVARFLPFAVCVVLVLFGCMSIVFNALMALDEADADTTKIKVGFVGTAGDTYLQWGMAAMEFDSTAMSMEISAMDSEDAAMQALEKGQIAAYIVIPEGFVDNALRGNMMQLKFVSTTGAAGLVSILKEEVTGIVDTLLVEAQSGTYGVGQALRENGYGNIAGKHVNAMSLEYVDFVFERSRLYRVEPLEIDGGIGFDKYMLGGLTVLFLMLTCLTFAPLYVRGDYALSRVLRSRRVSSVVQTAVEFGAYLMGLLLLLGVSVFVLQTGGLLPETVAGWELFLAAVPTLLMEAAFSYLLFELAENLISGVLLTFFATLVLCFIGGCMYPAFFFPVSVQKIAGVLPTGIARMSLSACFADTARISILPLLAYAVGFVLLAAVVRSRKLGKIRG